MVRFLLDRPIAVIMTFLALLIAGCAMFFALPVSMLPDIDIPRITVKATAENVSARQMENTVTGPLRRQLMQVSGIDEIRSESHDGNAVIILDMEYGVDTDLAFIEANEKIDAAMALLPRETPRPKVIKSSAATIPVTYLNMTLKADTPGTAPDAKSFYDLGEIARNVVRRRLEQQPQIAMVDMTGIPEYYLQVMPDESRIAEAGISIGDIENALRSNNIDPGNLTVREGYYQYSLSIPNMLASAEDVGNIYIRKGERVIQLKDLCDISILPRTSKGFATFNGRQSVTLAIIKQDSETMGAFEDALRSSVEYFRDMYPDIEFTTSRSQTELLDYSISNLRTNLLLGLLLVFASCALFMGDMRSPLVVGICICVAIILTFLAFYLLHVSFNIISLAGLILAVGMMIDNSVIVTENIAQYRKRGYSLRDSCALGTHEIITPMLSSSLTTIAVFVPLVFMSGIAGAIFTDQALSITAGLACSYITGITLLPVLFMLVFRGKKPTAPQNGAGGDTAVSRWLLRWYDKGLTWVFSHKALCVAFILLSLPMGIWVAVSLPKAGIPEIDGTETLARIDWNDNIAIDDNMKRTWTLLPLLDSCAMTHSAYVGVQDYMLYNELDLSNSECEIYLKAATPAAMRHAEQAIASAITSRFPGAICEFKNPGTVFDHVFNQNRVPLEARVYPTDRSDELPFSRYESLRRQIEQTTGMPLPPFHTRRELTVTVNREKLTLYNVDFEQINHALSRAFHGNRVTTLRSFEKYLPVEITLADTDLRQVLTGTMVSTHPDNEGSTTEMPLARFVSVARGSGPRNIVAGNAGEYVPYPFQHVTGSPESIINTVEATVKADNDMDVEFAGGIFSNMRMLRQLLLILAVSVVLIYFILCAQFESFLQPLIVLLEIPFDAAFALLALWLAGDSLNVMSAIGIIVTSGIVVNDSILKLDATNELRKSGMPLFEAIHTAGNRRLRAIVMTSLTTIVAMVPVLFSSDIGSQLQRPLAIAMISSMIVGTLVSIFIIPLIYWFIYRSKHESPNPKEIPVG